MNSVSHLNDLWRERGMAASYHRISVLYGLHSITRILEMQDFVDAYDRPGDYSGRREPPPTRPIDATAREG